ncbi:acyltransferase family protein [Spiroplasma turonicum]|uniref:Acyltransferase 3 domain-containing protein n=1 Tax=Spiroplasma turonicum TaxID=216946 RepID=A0A0K1P7U6_9MOLU|nr:acyltransferase family protein [Spiroplasma turonicum]AKU79957.1 hypothetical protein STURON_00711 [Spiroplasma turonicum]ALX70970.1 hypothetical protein STURO_v1c07110 [Spiroplasma turonicum]
MKNSNIELLRFFMALLIVFFHQYVVFYWKIFLLIKLIILPWIFIPTLVFILITGFYKVNSNKLINIRFLFVVFICWLLNIIIASIVFNFTKNNIPFLGLLLGGRDWWYLWAILLIQLMAPIINKILHSFNKYYILFIIVTLYILLEFTNNYIYGKLFGISNILAMILMYMIGGLIRLEVKLNKIYHYIFCISFLIIHWIISSILSYYYDFKFLSSQLSIWYALFAIVFFTLIVSIKPYNNKFINYIGGCSLFVYLYHYLPQILEEKYLTPSILKGIDQNLSYLIFSTITYISTFVFAAIIYKPINHVSNKFANFKIFRKLSKFNCYKK